MTELFNIDVPMWMWWLSQAVGVVGLVILIWCWQCRRKVRTLTLVTIARVLSTIASALLLNWVLAVFFGIAAIRGLVVTWLEIRRERGREPSDGVTMAILGVSLVATAVFMAMTAQWWFDWVLLVLGVIFVFAEWARGIHLIRGSQFALSSAMLVNAYFFANIMGAVKAVAVMGSIAVFYIRRRSSPSRKS